MTELDYSVLDPLEPLDENKGVDYSVLEPLTPETRAKDKQQKDIAELTARKEALEGRIATVKDTPVLKPTSEMSALGWSNVPRMGGLETSLQKTQSELSSAENRDVFWDTVMFEDFKHDDRTIKVLKESLDNVSRNPSPNLEPDKHYHNTERLNKIAKHYENEDEQSQVYRHFTEEELFDEKTRQKRFAELGLDDRAMADQIRGLLGNFEEAGINIPVDKALATTVVNSVLDNMFKERVLELAKVPFAYDGEGNVQGKTGFGRSVRLNRQILDGEDYVEPTWGNLIKAGFKSVFYPLAGQNQAQAEYDRQLSELAQGKDVRITQYVSVPAGGVGGGMAGVQKVVDPKTWGDKMWLDFARTHNLMDAWEGIPKDASPEDKYAAMQQAAGKELYRKQQNRENAEEIMRITGTHPIRSGFGEAWGSLGWTLQFALGGAVVGQTAMKGAQEQSDRLLTAKFNEDGSVQYEEDSFDRAFTKGLLNASVETASEFTSEVIWDAMFKALFSKLPGTDVLAKNVTKQMVKRSSGRAILRTARQMAAMGKAVHRGGVLSEHMEEVTAGFFNALFNYEMLDSEALATGSTVGGRVREFFTPENQLQTLEQVGYTTLLLGAVGLPIGGAQAAIGEYKANNALRSTLRHLGMDLQASEALLDRDLSTQIQATFNELGRRVKEGEKLDPVISTYLMAYYGASKDVLKNMSARERNDYLAKRLQEKSVIDDNNARALLHETGVKPEVTEKMNSEELQEAVMDVLGTLKNGLGEETLARILEEAGIDPKAIPDNIAGKVKLAREIITSGQFRVLQIETRKFDKAMQLEAQRMADAQAWAIQSEENSKATFEGDLTPLLESPLENPVVSDDNVTIFLDPENNRYVVSNKITGRDDMVFVPFTPDQKADAKALQEAADRQARIADVARETLNRRESIIQTAAGNLLRNGEKVTLVDNTEQAQRYLESKGIDKPVTGRVPGLTLKGRNEILLIRDNISSSMLLMETLLHERFHLALDNLGITNEQFAKFVAKATGLNEKEILEDAEKIRKTYSKQGVKLDLNQAIEEAVAHKLETGQLLFEPSLWRYLGDKALGIKSHKISNDLGRVLAGLDNIQSKFNKGWEADSAPLEEQGEAEQETQQPETERETEQEQPEVVPEATPEATPETTPEAAPQEKISPKGPDIPGMLSQVGLTKKNILDAKLDKDQIAELYNTIEQWLEDGDNAPLDAILERFDLPRPEIQEKGEDAQDATPDAPVEEKTDQEAQSETETEPETVETEQEPAPEKEPEESKPEEKEPEPEPREPSITIKDLAKLGEDAKNGDKEAHKKLVELLGEDNAVILQGDVVDYDTATQEQLKDAEETGKVINDFPLSEVHFDPDRFQFRYIYGEKGASGALEGIKKYDKKQGGTLWLWRDPKDGKAYVVNGHNRGAAAIRLGVTHHNVAFFQAKSDGEARRMGAEMNIREGNGSALDAAKFFRETKMTLEDFEALNIPMRQSMGKRGYALAQLVESLFRKVVSGEIDESVGVAIGENLPDLNAQVQLMEYLKKQRKRDLTIGVVAEIAKIANVAVEKETKEGGAEQIDLFGEEVGRNKLILETAQVRAEIARRLGRDKRLFGMVSKLTNKERLEQEGNLIDAETGKAISQEAGLILNLFHILKETDLVKVIEQAAQEVANGTGISKAVGDIMGEVKTTVLTAIGREVEGVEQTGDDIPSSGGDVQKPSETGTATPREDLTLDALTPEQEKAEQEKIKEQKRKRAEREEIEKRTAAPLKGDSGDLTSTLPSMEGTSDAPLFTENDRIGEQEKGGEKAEPAKTPDKQPEPEKKPTEAPTERKTEPETEQVVVTDGGEAFLEQWNEWLKEGRPPHKSPMGYGPDADAKTAVFEANVIALANRGKKLPDAQKADIRGTHKVTGDGIKLKAIKLKTPREAAAPITSKDTTRRALNGVYYDAENQLIVATDGPSAIAIPAEVKESKIVLVGKTVVEQRDLGKKNGEEIEGEYPNWKTIEPDVSHNHTSRKLDIEATRKSVTASSIVGNSYDNVSGVTNLGTEAIPRLVESDRLLRGITALLESGAKEITLHYNTDDLKHPVTLRADNGAKFILMPTRSKFLREGRAVAAAAYTTDPVFTPVKFKEPTDLNETPKLLGFMTAQELAKYPKRAGNYGVGFTDKVPFEKRLSDAIEEIKEYHKEGKYAKYVKDRLMSLERANKILESAGLPPMTISELTSTPQEQETPVANGEEGKTKTAPAAPAAPTPPARTEFIARGTKVVGKDTDGVAYSGEIEAYNAADDTYTLNVLKVKQPGKAMLPLPIDAKTGNRQVLKKNLPADSVNPIDVNKGPSKLTEAEKRKLRIIDAARDSEIGANVDESISERLERVGGEEVQTPGDKDAAKYGNKSVTDNEIRFKITSPVEERGQLVAVHNLGIKQLEAVVNELGGFAMPSVAVTKPEIGHTEFGEVSVLFGKDTIDPAKSSYNKIYSGDAYTPSFPEVGVKMNEKAVIAVERRLSPLAKGNRMLNGTLHGMEDDIRRAGSPVEAYQYSPEMYALYAADRHGVEITPEMDMNALRSIRSDNPSYEDGYLGWLDETFKGTIVKKGFRNSKGTFAPSGARRSFEATHDPMTLANAVKIMRKKQQSGGQGGFFDTSVIGAARQPFKNIAQVKQAADQLTSIDDAEFNAQKRKVTDQWFDLASALDKENGFQGGFGGVTPVDIANAIAKSRDNPIRIRTFLRNLGYNKVSSELANDIAQLARDAAKVPTRYYEAKPARGVGLEEAKAVILPDSAPKSLVDALQKRGTHLEFYKADDKADRIRVLNQVADTVDNVRFKITPEERELALQQFKDTEKKYGGQAAFEKARKDGKTVLNYRQWVQVRTPAFLEWFGDWMHDPENASKVVNPETGEPLVVYHGTRAGTPVLVFEAGRSTVNSTTFGDIQTTRAGIFFSDNSQFSEQFGDVVQAVYLRIENPAEVTRDLQLDFADTLDPHAERDVWLLAKNAQQPWQLFDGELGTRFVGFLKSKGYDGATFEEAVETSDTEHEGRTYVAFRPDQIKSAIANIGSFSDQTDDIRYKITGDEVAAMWPDYFEDQEQRERLQALRGEREKFYSHENREITGIALDSSKATTEDFLRRVYKMGVETVQNRQADSEVVERSTNTFATEKGKLRALELVEEYASLDGQDLSQFNKRAPSVDERMLMFQLMRQHVFHLENASERFLRSEGAERNAIGQEMRALEGSLDRVITGLRVASTLAGRVLRNHQVGLDSLNMPVYRMARAEREKGAPLNEDEKREIMEKFRAYEKEHSRLTEELNQMEKQYQSERMAKEIAEREFAVAKEAIAKLAVTKTTTRKLQNLIEWEDGVMFKITPEEDAAYLDAVESGDIEAAQRMVDEAAKRAGVPIEVRQIESLKPLVGFKPDSQIKTNDTRPILIDSTGTVLDGNHRLEAAKRRGDTTINVVISKADKNTGRLTVNEDYQRIYLGKSADAVTYDDAGRVIPLSRRFDDARADIRFKLPGVKLDAEYADAAPGASSVAETRYSLAAVTPAEDAEYMRAVEAAGKYAATDFTVLSIVNRFNALTPAEIQSIPSDFIPADHNQYPVEWVRDASVDGRLEFGPNGFVRLVSSLPPDRAKEYFLVNRATRKTVLPDGKFWRFTNNKKEITLAKNGTMRNSRNAADGTVEPGVSVAQHPGYSSQGYKYAYLVTGDFVGFGSDGEPVLSPESLKPLSKLMTAEEVDEQTRATLSNSKQTFLAKYGWTEKQFDAFQNGVAVGGLKYLRPNAYREYLRTGKIGWLVNQTPERTTGGPDAVIRDSTGRIVPLSRRSDLRPADIRYSLNIEGPRRPVEKIRLMTSPAKLKAHPDYEAAKAGDSQAAARVAAAVVKPDKIRALAAGHPDAVLVPVRAEEAAGANQLPVALAGAIRLATGLEVDHGIVQSVRAHRTGEGRAYRMEHRPQFKGDVVAGREYILVDDMATMGGTLAELRHYIESRGGVVVDAATFAAARFGSTFSLTPQTEAGLLARAGVNYLHQFLKERGLYGGNWKYLSEGEGREILKALPPDGGRDGGVAGQGAGDAAIHGRTPGRDSGDDGHVPVRYALDLTGGSYSKENLIVGYMAHADLTGGPFPSRARVAALADAIGLERHRYNDLAERARALSASTVDDAIRRAAASAAPDAAAFAIGEMARAAERALVRAGAAEGARLARSGERIRSLAESGVAAAMRAVTGADYADLQTDTGIDLAASLLAADPKSFGPEEARKRDEAAGAILPDPFTGEDSERVETDEDAPELTDAQRAEIARKRRERESRVQAMLDAAAARASTNRARDEERRRRREAAALADAEDAAGGGEAGADAASGGDAPADPVADALAADTAAPIDLSDRWLAAAILRVWAFARFRRENPLRHDTRGDLTKNRVAVEFYRKTAVRQLTDLARKLLEPGAPRESIRAHIADIAPHLTANQIERRTAFIFGLINRHAIRESQRGLVRKFRAQIKRQFVKGKEFEELGVDIDRTLTGAVEEDARYVMRVCELSDKALDGEPSALEKERARIEAVIAEREGMTDEHGNPLAVGGDDMQLRRALRQLALLDKYGAMVDMMPGEILDLTGEALASLGREALDLAARWEEYDRLVKRIKDPIVRSVSRKPTDPKAADSTLNKAADSTLSMLRQRLDWLTRYEGDPSKREEARAAISDLMNLLAEGHTGYVTARADDRAALMKALGEIFKKPDGRPDRRAIRAYLRRLDEKIPRALAGQLTRQGNQASMTYGQMLHLLAYLDQWASYSDNIIRHDRRGQAALIRSFTYEDPKTGEVRRALTSEDTQLLEWLRRAHYAGKRDVISNVMVRLCGREVESPDPLYHPVRMLQERRASLAAAARVSSWQPLAGVFSRRRKHRLDVDESASILDMFENRSHETAVLTAFGETGLVIREVLTSRAFQDAVRRFHGEKTLSRILRQVAQSLDGGRARGGGQSAAASLAQRVSTYMYLGFNLHSASKQTASLPVFAARMGFRKLGSILFSPIDRDAVRRLKEADEYRARYGTGPASGMSAADREAYSGYDTSPLRRFFGDWGLAPTRWADAFVSLWVGQGVYRDYLAQYLDMGMSREDAERRAISETYSLIEETQQSGRAENLPEMSREHGILGRLMVQFATSPLQQMQYEIKEFAEWRDLVNNGGPEASIREARNKFMRAAFINHILVPGMMAALSNAFKLATGDEPDWERDGFLSELMIAAIMGQFGRIFFAGALTEQTLRVLFLRKPPYMGQLVPAEGMIRFAGNLAYPVRDIITWDTEHFRGDIMRLLKSIALTRVPARIYERATEGE